MFLIILLLLQFGNIPKKLFLPLRSDAVKNVHEIQLTNIGHFGEERSERPNIPAHLHTGIDIKRPSQNYKNELIYPVAKGIIISVRDDGPYAQLIIEHEIENKKFWTVTEHIAGIMVSLNDSVDPQYPIARFMNKEELNKYGWQFNHFHFEVLKNEPVKLKPTKKTPQRLYNSYTLVCYTIDDLEKYFFDPRVFLEQN